MKKNCDLFNLFYFTLKTTWMYCCMIETSFVPPRKSSVIFGNLRQFLDIARKRLSGFRTAFGEFRRSWESVFMAARTYGISLLVFNYLQHPCIIHYIFTWMSMALLSLKRSKTTFGLGSLTRTSDSSVTVYTVVLKALFRARLRFI